MHRALYSVVKGRQGWVIRLNGKEFGPSPSQDDAVGIATRAGAKAHQRGCHAQVILYDGSLFRTVWMNGRDLAQAAG